MTDHNDPPHALPIDEVALEGDEKSLFFLETLRLPDKLMLVRNSSGVILIAIREVDDVESETFGRLLYVVERLNSIAMLLNRDFRPVTAGTMRYWQDGKRHISYARIRAELSFSGGPYSFTAFAKGTQTATQSFLERGLADPRFHDALRLFMSEPRDFQVLYRIFENVRDGMGGEREIVNLGWATQSEITAFRATANDPRIGGDGARHPPPGGNKKIPKGMARADADDFVRALLLRWLDVQPD